MLNSKPNTAKSAAKPSPSAEHLRDAVIEIAC